MAKQITYSEATPRLRFGQFMKGMRLGWSWSDKHGAFIRMSEVNDKILIELAPFGGIPSKKTPSGVHRCWWDDPGILDCLPWLKNVRRIKKYVAVNVNNNGEIIRKDG